MSVNEEKKKLSFGCFKVNLTIANLFFALLGIISRVGINVALPLWIDSQISEETTTQPNSTCSNSTGSNHTSTYTPKIGPYFIISFLGIMLTLLNGIALAVYRLFHANAFGETEKNFPKSQLFFVALLLSMNEIFIGFSSSHERTPLSLQSILANTTIPMVITMRYFILRKQPTRRKLVCATVISICLFFCFIPSIFPSIGDHEDNNVTNGKESILWSLVFMAGSVPAAASMVYGEKILKTETSSEKRELNVMYFVFMVRVYVLVIVTCLFFVDIIPGFGYAQSISQLFENWFYGFQCFFGGAGCDGIFGFYGTLCLFMMITNYIAMSNLTRYSEGATLVALVSTVSTPLGFLFWTIFSEPPFKFNPVWHNAVLFPLFGVLPMIPAIYFYKTGNQEKVVEKKREKDESQALMEGNHHSINKYV